MSKEALVTGATGLIGSHIAEALVAKGWDVCALCRANSDCRHLESIGVELRRGDLTDPSSLHDACRGVEVVFHAAAKLGEWSPRQEFVELNVTAVADLVEAMAGAGARRLVHVSSVAVYGRQQRRGITEDTPSRMTGNPYMDTKAEGERVAMEAAQREGIELTIVRPSLVYGPRDRNFLPHLIHNLKRGRLVIVGSGKHQANTAYAGTVADLCLACASHAEAPGQAFNVVDPDPLTWREFLTAVALRIGCEPPRMAVPTSLVYGAGWMMEIVARAIGSPKPPPMTRFVAGALGFDLSYSTRKAEELLAFHPRISVREGLDRSIESAGRQSPGSSPAGETIESAASRRPDQT